VNELQYGAAVTLGLLGGSHCMFMCGGIGSALGMGVDPSRRYWMLALFQAGRVGSYTLLGAGLGASLGLLGTHLPFGMPALRILSGLLLISMGCYISNWWQGLLVLEGIGKHLWRHIQPLTQALLPVRHAHQAVLIGLCWGFLPCGLIYTALAWSAGSGNGVQSALLMFCFGLGTAPVMFATGAAGERMADLLRRRGFRRGAAGLLIAFGLWTIYMALQPAHGDHHALNEGSGAGHHHQRQSLTSSSTNTLWVMHK
jgi:sulfite exporter TauE/SafE